MGRAPAARAEFRARIEGPPRRGDRPAAAHRAIDSCRVAHPSGPDRLPGVAADDTSPSTLPPAGGALSLSGVGFALSAYLAWGFAPLYWKQLGSLSATELLTWRILLSAALATVLVGALGLSKDVGASLRRTRGWRLLSLSAMLLGSNWWIFIYAVNTDRIVDTSLGYYLTPLLNVALGLLFFGERLRLLQWCAVALAALGVGYMAIDLGRLPWISLALGTTFALYGAIRKSCEISSLGGLLVESTLLAVPATIYLLARELGLTSVGDAPPAAGYTARDVAWLSLSGVVTAFPLVCFAGAARRLPLSAVGLFQYIAPSRSLLVAVLLYGEPFTLVHLTTFALIWLALAIYVLDGLSGMRAARGR